ncbi:MAG TPA: hypothetical protein VK468_02205, partial [Pyrinomonadaceae bacterium]|nr:hypothetical protein [Pyrinomonadaceae bacterium]
RLRLYRKYDGDLYDKNIRGLFEHQEIEFERQSNEIERLLVEKSIALDEYKIRQKELETMKSATLRKLNLSKETELNEIRRREKELWKQFKN